MDKWYSACGIGIYDWIYGNSERMELLAHCIYMIYVIGLYMLCIWIWLCVLFENWSWVYGYIIIIEWNNWIRKCTRMYDWDMLEAWLNWRCVVKCTCSVWTHDVLACIWNERKIMTLTVIIGDIKRGYMCAKYEC